MEAKSKIVLIYASRVSYKVSLAGHKNDLKKSGPIIEDCFDGRTRKTLIHTVEIKNPVGSRLQARRISG
jgi:hypothetical protein